MKNQPRAKTGGEYGPNGEFYTGGAFIATTELSKKERKHAAQQQKELARKVLIAPFEWAVRPSLDVCAIYSTLCGVVADFRGPHPVAIKDACAFRRVDVQKVQAILDRYASGERWMPVGQF